MARTQTDHAAHRLENVYWLGGASGAAKSTIARRLAARYGLELYACDATIDDHAARARPRDVPYLEAFRRMTMDERWVLRSPQEMLDTFHWFHGEAFGLIIEDLRDMSRHGPVIAEGFRLLPRLVRPHLVTRRQGLWLVPTESFRHQAFEARGTMWVIPDKTSKPGIAKRNLMARDALFTRRLASELAELDLPFIVVDGSQKEDDLIGSVAAHFGL